MWSRTLLLYGRRGIVEDGGPVALDAHHRPALGLGRLQRPARTRPLGRPVVEVVRLGQIHDRAPVLVGLVAQRVGAADDPLGGDAVDPSGGPGPEGGVPPPARW